MEEFVKKIKYCWKPYDATLREYALIQFQQNLKEEKKIAAQWAKDKKLQDDKLLKEVEEGLGTFYNSEVFGYLNEAQNMEVKLLEEKKRNVLLEKEKQWRIKSKAI
jgi:hypothetical protein